MIENILWMSWQDAITWLLSPPDQSLALLLADNGFDVWLTSTRGTKYSQGHTSLSTNDAVSFFLQSTQPTAYWLLGIILPIIILI